MAIHKFGVCPDCGKEECKCDYAEIPGLRPRPAGGVDRPEYVEACLHCRVPNGCEERHELCGFRRAAMPPRSRWEDRERVVLAELRAAGDRDAGAIGEVVSLSRKTVQRTLQRLAKKGLAWKAGRYYRVVEDG